MYSITHIRLNPETRVFENTQLHGLFLEEDAYEELVFYGCPEESLNKFKSLNKGDRMTGESTITNGIKKGLHFIYINRIS
mgnify:CR=1 FL=1